MDDGDVVANVLDQIELMGREQDRRPFGCALLKDLRHRFDTDRVETRKGLVEHQQLRVVHERCRQLHPLLVAVGKSLDLVGAAFSQAEPLEPAAGARPGFGLAHAMKGAEIGELVFRFHLRVEAPGLGHIAEPKALIRADRFAMPGNRAGVGCDQSEYRPHGRGLAGPVGPEKTEHAARAAP